MKEAKNEHADLAAYRAKRDPGKTPEPMGAEGIERPRLFVVQQHWARALHFDLRLEEGGVLKCWAVPKGPSDDPKDKRMAVETEDHPLEYADFEGIIPTGNYGAGAMIVWDRGHYVPLIPLAEGFATGKHLFELHGYKLRGRYTLVKLKKEPRGWLLIKERDEWANATGEAGFSPRSVLSGLTVQELKEGAHPGDAIRRELERLSAHERSISASDVQPMLAETRERPFSHADWWFEIKYDGYRLLAEKSAAGARLLYRSGRDATRTFPEIARAVAALPHRSFVLDGEVVVLDPSGRPSFSRLQERGQISGVVEAERAAVENPAALFAFDLLAYEGWDLRGLPLRERKRLLRAVVPDLGPLRFTDHVEERGVDFHAAVAALGLEGAMAKRASSPYRAGRSADWLKLKVDRTGDFAIVGWKESEARGRPGFAGLHLAVRERRPEGDAWVYAGSVGSGFTEKQLNELRARLEPLPRGTPIATGALPKTGRHVWLEAPALACEVRFKEWTKDDHLRHPVFLRLREDKRPEECVRERDVAAAEASDGHAEPPPVPLAPTARKLRLTNLDKVFWPDEGYTKGDLIAYYRTIAPWLLPYLRDRPLVLDRYPDGIGGKSFYQKDAPSFLPEWIRTVAIASEGGDKGERDIHYILCDDADALALIANLGAIPLHVWASRSGSLARLGCPDWAILDLDPKGAPFSDVAAIARFLGDFCRDIGWTPFLKTSGGTGLHILLPLGGLASFEQARQLAEVIARHAAHALPKIATVERSLAARRGRVYVDFLQNGRGKLIAAPFSARPRPGATVSTPLRWEELKSGLDPAKFTIRTVPKRMKRLGEDPLAPVLTTVPDLGKILEALHDRM